MRNFEKLAVRMFWSVYIVLVPYISSHVYQ